MRVALVFAVAFWMTACTQDTRTSMPERPAPPVPVATTTQATAAGDELRYQDAAGRTLLTMRPQADGYKFYDAGEQVFGEVKVQADRVKLKDSQGIERFKIKRKDYGAEIEDANGQRLFKIKGSSGGEWKVEDAADITLFKCKPKETGYEVRDASGATVAKVKAREGKLVFETEAGERIAELKGGASAQAGLWLAIARFSLPERGALCAYFTRVQP